MSLLQNRGTLEKAAESDLGQILKAAGRSTLESALGNGTPAAAALKGTKPLGWAAKPILMVAGGVAGITAASAAVSAVRRAQEEA